MWSLKENPLYVHVTGASAQGERESEEENSRKVLRSKMRGKKEGWIQKVTKRVQIPKLEEARKTRNPKSRTNRWWIERVRMERQRGRKH